MITDTEHLSGLNKEQREAAVHMNGPLLIIAGAGAGKTKTITHRIVNLIKEGVAPERILAVTFTNKAAKEMRERIIGEIEKNVRGQEKVPFVSTFHSLGVYIIKENARILGLTKHFTILDEGESTRFVKEILKELGIDPKQYDPKKIKNIISREKGKFTHLADYTEREASGTNTLSKIVAQVWNLYEKQKMKENSLDFDDLLLKATKLLKDNAEIRKMYQEKWEYVHIDEYQDTNEVQYLMSKMLAENNKNICVVGDADQNIYSWRGANLKNILSFEKDYPDAKIVLLEENYRSTKNILEAANVVIKKNKYRPDKNLFTKNETGEKIGLYEALEENDEADFVATKILEIWDRGTDLLSRGVSQADEPRGSAPRARGDSDPAKAESVTLSDIAILYRANFQSRALEEAMLRYNIPYQVLGVKFFERKEIKDTLAYLRAALNRDSLSDIKRIINFPVRGIGKVTLVKIFAGETESLPAKMRIKINNFYETLEEIKEKIHSTKTSEVIKFVVKKTGIEAELSSGSEEDMERLENIRELATLALKYDNLANAQENARGVEKLLEDASLASDQDSLIINQEKKEKINAVKLMTVHAAKGLEFKYVFVTGLENGLFPHQRHNEDASMDSEEERRLFYVAITRARSKLFLSFANFRTIFGSRQINTPSEFISDIPKDLLEKEGEKGGIKTIYLD
ncbi:MAG: UvrD-helicase domain-containing protein [Patescibacteria group bacterium]